VTMHPAPPDFQAKRDTLADQEDAHPDRRPASLNADGGHKKEHEAEFFDSERGSHLLGLQKGAGQDDAETAGQEAMDVDWKGVKKGEEKKKRNRG